MCKGCDLTPFEKGIDFVLHFTGKQFTIQDIADRYQISKRQAFTLKQKADFLLDIKPDGICLDQAKKRGPAPDMWTI